MEKLLALLERCELQFRDYKGTQVKTISSFMDALKLCLDSVYVDGMTDFINIWMHGRTDTCLSAEVYCITHTQSQKASF